jgi:hypothetical protein
VDGRAQASGSDAVLRTAKPGHDELKSPENNRARAFLAKILKH